MRLEQLLYTFQILIATLEDLDRYLGRIMVQRFFVLNSVPEKKLVLDIPVSPKERLYYCEYCNVGGMTSESAEKHILSIHCVQEIFYECHNCGKRYKEQRMREHLEESSCLTIECPICADTFSGNSTKVYDHLASSHGRICPVCKKRGFSDYWAQREHLQEHGHDDEKSAQIVSSQGVDCPLCDATGFGSVGKLVSHTQKKHVSDLKSRCGGCNQAVLNAEMLEHLQDTREKQSVCSRCRRWGEPASLKHMLHKHKRNFGFQEVFTCNICGTETSGLHAAVEHFSEQHYYAEGGFSCYICGEKYFSSLNKLVTHLSGKHQFGLMRIQDMKKSGAYLCPQCEQEHDAGEDFRQHVKHIHGGSISTDEYQRKRKERTEEKISTQEIYRCRQCEADFDDKNDLLNHERWAH